MMRAIYPAVGLSLCLLLGCDQKEGTPTPSSKESEQEKLTRDAKGAGTPSGVEKGSTPVDQAIEADIRLVVLSDDEPLGSEKAQIKNLVTNLKSKGEFSVDDRPASASEKEFLAAVTASKAPGEPPALWKAADQVVSLRMLPPSQLADKRRITEGRGDLMIFEPGAQVPRFAARVALGANGDPGRRRMMDGVELGRWLKQDRRMLLKGREEAQKSAGEKEK